MDSQGTKDGQPSSGDQLSVDYIKQVIRDSKVGNSRKVSSGIVPAGAQATHQVTVFNMIQFLPSNHYDEVVPNIFLGDFWLAKEKGEMKKLGITHVVNTAQGKKFSQIDTNAEYYADIGVQYYGIEGAMDTAGYKICGHFRTAAQFIKDALDGGGRVYVHCHQGISRSSSVVLAFQMLYVHECLEEAIRVVRTKRAIFPNDGFIKQLIELQNELHAGDNVQS